MSDRETLLRVVEIQNATLDGQPDDWDARGILADAYAELGCTVLEFGQRWQVAHKRHPCFRPDWVPFMGTERSPRWLWTDAYNQRGLSCDCLATEFFGLLRDGHRSRTMSGPMCMGVERAYHRRTDAEADLANVLGLLRQMSADQQVRWGRECTSEWRHAAWLTAICLTSPGSGRRRELVAGMAADGFDPDPWR